MHEPQRLATAVTGTASVGFIVSRSGDDVEIAIPAPKRAGSLFGNIAISLILLAGCILILQVSPYLFGDDPTDILFCGMMSVPVVGGLMIWFVLGGMRRIASARRLNDDTRIGIAGKTVWCRIADRPDEMYHWQMEDVWNLRIVGRRMRGAVWLRIRGRGRPLVMLPIPCRMKVAIEPLESILRQAIGFDLASPSPACADSKPTAQEQAELAALRYASDSTLTYFNEDRLEDWVTVAAYEKLLDWYRARSALAAIEIFVELDWIPGARDAPHVVQVRKGQAERARRWLAMPQYWFDRSRCPRCGTAGSRLPMLRRLLHGILHPLAPMVLTGGWLFCGSCQELFHTSDAA
jgi:hypothetical protein